jgi:hypothetical protein
MTPLAASISDATIWSVTFDDTRNVDYDRNSFIIQATDLIVSTTPISYDDQLRKPKTPLTTFFLLKAKKSSFREKMF